MEVVPASVGRAAHGWDEQHLDVAAAAGQVGAAGSGGFTAAVAGPAARFLTTWERHLGELGDAAEARADGLRTAIEDFVTTDRATFDQLVSLAPYVREER